MTIQINKDDIFDKLPKECYVCQKVLWYKEIRIEIDHIDNDLDKPLDYQKAAKALLRKLTAEIEGCVEACEPVKRKEIILDHERRNAYCAKCGNNVMCTFREADKTEQEIIQRCAEYNNWFGSDKYHKIIAEIDANPQTKGL